MRNKFSNTKILLVFFILLSCWACKSGNKDEYTDTPTSGKISIVVDETFKPIAQTEIDVFQSIYSFATINATYDTENAAFDKLLKDSVRMIICSRKLYPQEKAVFDKKKFFPKEIKIATDAIALIVNADNKDTLISIQNLKEILNGKITNWNQIYPNSKLGKIKLVFDNQHSSTVSFLFDSISRGDKFSTELSALTYNTEVIDYVSKTKNAIGIIGTSFVSDKNDSTSLSFLKEIKVMAVSKENKATYENSFQPYQAYVATKQYPLTRDVYIILSEPRAGLASGFTSFLTSDRGQRIILKSGILPATQPVRIVNVKNSF
ncbi:MAG: substrate-binding domain-containing protein [Bacteroidetes bacterium]|nr:substrate-binding domain-containing protein [Bacteroidota bacterium]